jgi:polysaccharide deacetylase 2 family uncharacterized protein YibQ
MSSMAVQPKKKSTTKAKSTTKKKPTPKKPITKPRKRKSKKKKHTKKRNSKKNIFIVLVLFLMFTLIGFGFYLGQNSDNISTLIENGEIEGDYTTKQLLEDLAKIKSADRKEKPIVKVKEKIKSKPKPIVKIKVAKTKRVKSRKPTIKKTALAHKSYKPKLVIIIDDVSRLSQLNAIHATGMKLTPSIFPPSELSITSHHLARGLHHYMIHLPMESGSQQFNSQYKTLLTSFSNNQVDKRVHELRQLFPHARYINNHTGSVYTNSYEAMSKLYKALRKEGFVFIDSRTVGSSKVRQIAHKFGDAYVARDIFIDNIHKVSYIHNQLEKAVKMAKKKGYAIAIGHPHKMTMQALSSANEILKDVELVYIDRLYKKEK